jgi:hypothetical protein
MSINRGGIVGIVSGRCRRRMRRRPRSNNIFVSSCGNWIMRRLKKISKYLALSLGALIAVALIANAIFIWQTGTALEERVSQLRAAGAPLSLPELGAMPAPPGADAAAVLRRVEPELKALSGKINLLEDESKHPLPWSDKDWKELEKAFAAHPTVLPALAEAAACPSYRSPLNYQLATMSEDEATPTFLGDLVPYIQIRRATANVLKCQIDLQLRVKDYDGAMRTCLIGMRIARHTEKEPTLISHLVVIAVRAIGMESANEILQAGPIATALHTELESQLAAWDTTDAYRWCMQSERAYGLQALESVNGGGWLLRGFHNDEKTFYLDQMAEAINQADSSYAKFQADINAAKAARHSFRHVLSQDMLSALFKVREADFRNRCLVRCLRVKNALTEKKLAEVPASLADLGLPREAVIDPYTNMSLIARRVEGQWLVYGVGRNLKDDGGRVDDRLEDVGFGPKKQEQ